MFVTEIIKMILPVLIAIGIGLFCKKKQLFSEEGLGALKSIIGNITLPLVLFNAFFTAKYNLRVLLIFVVIFCACSVALRAGYLVRPLVKPYHTFTPFLLTCFEAGMLGYALYSVLVGAENISTFATIDVGQTIFAYTVYLAMLQSTDGKKSTAKSIVTNMIKKPAADGMLLGVLLGVLGLGNWFMASPIHSIYTQTISFITAPTACIILIIVGYELSLKKELLRPVFITVALRFLLCAVLLTLVSLLLFAIIPFDKNFMIGLMVMFSLPAPFVIPLFADVKNDDEYISTCLSMSTLCTIGLFMAIAVYSIV